MTVDEAVLTGESVPCANLPARIHIEHRVHRVATICHSSFSGTLVVQGMGMAAVVRTASDTAIGRIGKDLSGIKQETTRLQNEVAQVVKCVSWIGFALAGIVALWYGAAGAIG